MKVENADRLARKLRRMPQILRDEVRKAAERSSEELAENLRRNYSDDPALARTVRAEEVTGSLGTVWTVSVGDKDAFWARWREFGTAAGDRVYGSNTKQPGKVMRHPGADAIPTFFPTYRINQRRLRSRLRSASTRAAKKAAAMK